MPEQILITEYSEEMQKSYMNYSMSVITARAIPDARDGLKPVQRRVLYDMSELKLGHNQPHRKSARIVGDTMGKYHPHGDSSIYDTLVGLSQDFKKGKALVDGHGNFGSIEGDGAAAMRYTEARLEKFTEEVYLKDLDKTVRFVPNYDETETEPEVLPVRVPNLLLNGAEGIAVGMSTSIPPHNLGELVDAAIAYIDDPDISVGGLMHHLPGPDFPTGGIVANKSDLKQIYETGVGKIRLRGKVEVELGRRRADRDKLVITQIPYTMIGAGINKLMADIAALVETKKLSDIVDISNQSNKEGIRIVMELRAGADVEKMTNILYKKTKLEDTFGVNMLAIVNGRPETLSLRGIFETYLDFQYDNTSKKYQVLLDKALDQKEIQEGLIAACDCIDLIIAVLRGSKKLADAKACLIQGDTSAVTFRSKALEADAKKLHFTERQADAILEMRLYRLIGLEILALEKEYKETVKKIAQYQKILSEKPEMDRVIKEDLRKIKEEFAMPRLTVLEDAKEAEYEEAPPQVVDVVFVMDRFGYCKLLDQATYERNREAADQEYAHVVEAQSDGKICLFTDLGNLYQVKVSDVPNGKLRDKGTPIDNLSKYSAATEAIIYVGSATKVLSQKFVFATKGALVKQVPGTEFYTNLRLVVATKLSEGDRVIAVKPVGGGADRDGGADTADKTDETDGVGGGNKSGKPGRGGAGQDTTNIALRTAKGIFLKFALSEVPEMKKGAKGVRGIKLGKGDTLEEIYLVGDAGSTVKFNNREVHLGKMKVAKRDGSGSKVK
ncbi:MAG: DNA topoisomerase 4 subunit A [Lachnospiraceae bacterium]|jgi:DNA gyrase subunit A|nr:DNA topoisomerase 4 subunit A [Lachnospiraceae bacterium]